MSKYCVVLATVPSEELAVNMARILVEMKLAACVNIVPQIRSVYSWDNKICDDKELLLIVKSKKSVFKDLKKQILKLHSYEVPEVIMIPIEEGYKDYLKWIDKYIVDVKE